MPIVLQPWVYDVGLKMQSILLSGFRAPDARTKAVKKCVRWLRGNCQIDADPSKQSYMQTIDMTPALIDDAMDELEYLSVHYVHHFADSFAVLAYFHPEPAVRTFAYKIHYLVAEELFHFVPEAREVFFARHKDQLQPSLTALFLEEADDHDLLVKLLPPKEKSMLASVEQNPSVVFSNPATGGPNQRRRDIGAAHAGDEYERCHTRDCDAALREHGARLLREAATVLMDRCSCVCEAEEQCPETCQSCVVRKQIEAMAAKEEKK